MNITENMARNISNLEAQLQDAEKYINTNYQVEEPTPTPDRQRQAEQAGSKTNRQRAREQETKRARGQGVACMPGVVPRLAQEVEASAGQPGGEVEVLGTRIMTS